MMAFGFGGFGMLFTLLFWLLIAAVIVWALAQALPRMTERTSPRRPESAQLTQNDALEVLRQRYARGELSKEDYETMRKDLSS